MSAVQNARLQVAQGSRILAMQGIMDAFGHVSCRSPEREDRFFIPRNMAPALVGAEDVLELDLEGTPIADPDARVFLERFIHAEIYRARPEVSAIVHSHALEVLPFTVVPNAAIRPICHACGFLDHVIPPFDVSEALGRASDLLISNAELGRKFAAHLAGSAVGLMRSHGFTAVGHDVPQAVFRAIYTVRNCQVTLAAKTLGEPEFLSSAEAELCDQTTGSQSGRAWSLWLHTLESSQHSPPISAA